MKYLKKYDIIILEFKKITIVLGITIAICIGILFGSSYAWYAYKNAETSIEGSTINESPTIIFSQNEYLYFKNIVPILDEDRYNYASKNSFSITVGDNLKDYDVGIEISLKDIIMSNELKISNYKYELLENGISISNGDFSNIGTNSELILMPMTGKIISIYPTTYNYELYIWLSDNGTNQNNLMNKSFRAKINVNSATKK